MPIMEKMLLTDKTKARYDTILSGEQKFALSVAPQVVGKPEITPWMFLIPILFIPYLQRCQKLQEAGGVFCQGYMFTKKLALDVAYQEWTGAKPKAAALAEARLTVCRDPEADERVLEVYEKQMQEIDLLAGHYGALFRAEGEDCPSLVRHAYRTREYYTGFLLTLSQAEKEVNTSYTRAFGSKMKVDDNDTSRMEDVLAILRNKEADRFFAGCNM